VSIPTALDSRIIGTRNTNGPDCWIGVSCVTPSKKIYELGYVIGEFIVGRWGRAGLLDLIRAHGDVNGVFGMTPAAFETEMYAWIRATYL
jgi:hypothetical protein